jgi:hypothetical protein
VLLSTALDQSLLVCVAICVMELLLLLLLLWGWLLPLLCCCAMLGVGQAGPV